MDKVSAHLTICTKNLGYIIYTAHIQGYPVTHVMSVERLAPDFLSSTGLKHSSGFFGETFVEAPTMFERNGAYFAVFGHCCCYCGSGSPVKYYRSVTIACIELTIY
jgi:hypothetical protein